jgi:hypothetical protein
MPYSSFICPELIPVESVQVGRLVLDVKEPCEDYLDPAFEFQTEVLVEPQSPSEEEVQPSTEANTFTGFLARLTSTAFTRRKNIATKITTHRVTTYNLANPEIWFKNAIQEDNTREWVEQAIRQRDDIYVVLGYHTMLDVDVLEAGSGDGWKVSAISSSREQGGSVSSESAANPGFSSDENNPQSFQRHFRASGEQICALRYGKVRIQWLSSRELDDKVLEEGNRWRISWNVRGHQTGINDVVDANIRDDLELEDALERYTFGKQGDFFL